MTKQLIVTEDELFELYNILADATEAASTGDPNTVSKKAAEAKERVIEIRKSADIAEKEEA